MAQQQRRRPLRNAAIATAVILTLTIVIVSTCRAAEEPWDSGATSIPIGGRPARRRQQRKQGKGNRNTRDGQREQEQDWGRPSPSNAGHASTARRRPYKNPEATDRDAHTASDAAAHAGRPELRRIRRQRGVRSPSLPVPGREPRTQSSVPQFADHGGGSHTRNGHLHIGGRGHLRRSDEVSSSR